jgi:hypothetical protein
LDWIANWLKSCGTGRRRSWKGIVFDILVPVLFCGMADWSTFTADIYKGI